MQTVEEDNMEVALRLDQLLEKSFHIPYSMKHLESIIEGISIELLKCQALGIYFESPVFCQ
jgi:hypothetical protein